VTQALSRVRQTARYKKKARFTALLHHVNADTLRTAFLALKRKAAPGVDGVTWRDYEAELEPNLEDLARKVQLTELADEQDRLIAELQEDVGCRSRLSNSRRSSPRRSWRRKCAGAMRGCARKADIACPSQRDGLSLDRTCCRIRYAPTVALP
jgi:hypothetical protein